MIFVLYICDDLPMGKEGERRPEGEIHRDIFSLRRLLDVLLF